MRWLTEHLTGDIPPKNHPKSQPPSERTFISQMYEDAGHLKMVIEKISLSVYMNL